MEEIIGYTLAVLVGVSLAVIPLLVLSPTNK
jgi:hypothetical protein